MTRFLSLALGAAEPGFSQNIQQLEHAAGHAGADIHLTEETKLRTKAKIAELGLDPNDTTGEELYGALQTRLQADEARVREVLDVPPEPSTVDILQRVQQFVDKHVASKPSFALKNSVAKRLLKKKPPKIAMKRLGYRSLDSMLKHEPVCSLYAAAFIVESPAWHRAFREQYAKLTPADFEQRPMAVVCPDSKRWHTLAAEFTHEARRNILSFKELGAVVVLPLEAQVDGLAVTTLLLVLEEMNAIRAHSSYAKLQQVKPQFGRIMRDVASSEAYTSAYLAGQPVSWRTVQLYYAKHPDAYHPDIFELHVQPEDLQWLHAEDVLADIEPSLAFWRDTQALGLLHDGQLVSCNILDTALSFCNHLPFGQRVLHFVRDNLWHELMLRYLDQANLEEALRSQLSDKLDTQKSELAFAEQEQ